MYRDNYPNKLSFKTELHAVPSPRAEARAVSRLSSLFCAVWALACLAYYLVLKTYKITFDTRPEDLTHVMIAGVVPILFTPALPMHSVVRIFLAWGHRARVSVELDETGLKLARVGESRRENKQIDSFLRVQIGTSQHVVASAEVSDALFLFRPPQTNLWA